MISGSGKFFQFIFDFNFQFIVFKSVKFGEFLSVNFFSQNFRRRNGKTAAVRFIFCVIDFFCFRIDFQKKSDKRAADKTRARADRICSFGFSISLRRIKSFADFFRIKTHFF